MTKLWFRFALLPVVVDLGRLGREISPIKCRGSMIWVNQTPNISSSFFFLHFQCTFPLIWVKKCTHETLWWWVDESFVCHIWLGLIPFLRDQLSVSEEGWAGCLQNTGTKAPSVLIPYSSGSGGVVVGGVWGQSIKTLVGSFLWRRDSKQRVAINGKSKWNDTIWICLGETKQVNWWGRLFGW